MASQQKVSEIRLAVFGESGCGKTTLLSSYYGKQQSHNFEEEKGYALLADDKAQGNNLLANYYGMQQGHFPDGTSTFTTYDFSLRLKNYDQPSLKVCWYDYPGKWWVTEPSDREEAREQKECFKKLLESHVAILIVDGEKLDAKEKGTPYLKTLFSQFKDEVQRQQLAIKKEGLSLSNYPSQWIIALSKADLYSSTYTAKDFEKRVVRDVSEQLKQLSKLIRKDGQSSCFGSTFLLLSAAKSNYNVVVDAATTLGLELLAPLALLSVIEELAKKADRGAGFGVLGEILESFASVIDLIDKLDELLSKKHQFLTQLLIVLKLNYIAKDVSVYMREKQRELARKGKALGATACAMMAELKSDSAKRLYYCNQGSSKSGQRS